MPRLICRPAIVVLLIALPPALCRAEDAPAVPWNLRDHIPLEEVVVQSHRGAGALSPENSREAFEISWRLGAIPEADMRTSRDGVIVAFHDADFRRTLPDAADAEQAKGVADLSWQELKALDIGAWKGPRFAGQRIPRMTDTYAVLAKHPDRRMYIDVKNVDLEQLARESAAVHPQLILASTDYQLIRRWKRLAPKSATLLWMGGSEAKLTARLAEVEKAGFADVDQLQVHVRLEKDGAMKPRAEFLASTGERLRRHGVLFQTLPWECDDPEVFWRLMDLGAASFATDYPDVAMQAIRDYYQSPRDEGAP